MPSDSDLFPLFSNPGARTDVAARMIPEKIPAQSKNPVQMIMDSNHGPLEGIASDPVTRPTATDGVSQRFVQPPHTPLPEAVQPPMPDQTLVPDPILTDAIASEPVSRSIAADGVSLGPGQPPYTPVVSGLTEPVFSKSEASLAQTDQPPTHSNAAAPPSDGGMPIPKLTETVFSATPTSLLPLPHLQSSDAHKPKLATRCSPRLKNKIRKHKLVTRLV
jgi:hypothetical protein